MTDEKVTPEELQGNTEETAEETKDSAVQTDEAANPAEEAPKKEQENLNIEEQENEEKDDADDELTENGEIEDLKNSGALWDGEEQAVDEGYVSQFGELEQTPGIAGMEYAGAVAVKKKSKALPITIIIICVVLVLAIAAGAVYIFMFSKPSLNGTWEMITYSDAETGETLTGDDITDDAEKNVLYYTFTDDSMIMEQSTNEFRGKQEQKVSITNNEDGSYNVLITSDTSGMEFTIVYKCVTDGNLFTGETMQLNIEDESGTALTTEAVELTKVSSVKYEEITKIENFKYDEKLKGNWLNSDYGYTYIFDEDGIFTVKSDGMEQSFPYLIKESQILVKTAGASEEDMESSAMPYSVNDDKSVLAIGEGDAAIEFTKEAKSAE